ncbi:vasodilator-stimulated phosphoprotein-like [Schistocerca cancellata]|uniref:vasodilator-stimulated phosphoprotein-like n=1 Tax=Schistocerca cancellata TaxID=274614 RepID=UPI002117444F|nr:vasodilator-stimulated phosphoprotein-like [Schistocerca cancellata]
MRLERFPVRAGAPPHRSAAAANQRQVAPRRFIKGPPPPPPPPPQTPRCAAADQPVDREIGGGGRGGGGGGGGHRWEEGAAFRTGARALLEGAPPPLGGITRGMQSPAAAVAGARGCRDAATGTVARLASHVGRRGARCAASRLPARGEARERRGAANARRATSAATPQPWEPAASSRRPT